MDHQDWDSWNDDLPADASGGDAGGEPSADLGAEGLGGPDLAGLSGEVDLSGEVEDPDPLGEVPAGAGFDGSDQRPPEEPLGLDLPAADDPDTPWA
ncbi:MAG: hypothetical protein JXA67_20640, partial [Micromonosporaceae bacterium]|nr:hypothetical protein [Micromonosporaceae bacterium]